MLNNNFSGFLIFLICLILLIAVQRLLHREIQTIFLLLTRNPKIALALFSLILFPGVFLHEFSHWIMAILLRVPVKRVSLIPQTQKDGRLRLGFVETKATDFFRDSLIGLAPFITGCLVLTFIGSKLALVDMIKAVLIGNYEIFSTLFFQLPQQIDFGIWFYLAFCISSTMLPSSSDRESWYVILIGIGIILGIILIAGFGDWMIINLTPKLNIWIYSVSLILASSVFVHLVLLLPSGLFRVVIAKLMGLEISHK
ncbi:MAG: hypothetical protein CL609_22975 [Anaerolineaceae bacterium]|nr:hypothetical protein [Anaerolineaceae bacterium]